MHSTKSSLTGSSLKSTFGRQHEIRLGHALRFPKFSSTQSAVLSKFADASYRTDNWWYYLTQLLQALDMLIVYCTWFHSVHHLTVSTLTSVADEQEYEPVSESINLLTFQSCPFHSDMKRYVVLAPEKVMFKSDRSCEQSQGVPYCNIN